MPNTIDLKLTDIDGLNIKIEFTHIDIEYASYMVKRTSSYDMLRSIEEGLMNPMNVNKYKDFNINNLTEDPEPNYPYKFYFIGVYGIKTDPDSEGLIGSIGVRTNTGTVIVIDDLDILRELSRATIGSSKLIEKAPNSHGCVTLDISEINNDSQIKDYFFVYRPSAANSAYANKIVIQRFPANHGYNLIGLKLYNSFSTTGTPITDFGVNDTVKIDIFPTKKLENNSRLKDLYKIISIDKPVSSSSEINVPIPVTLP